MNPIIKMIDSKNVNSFYNPTKSNDGGGYWQPLTKCIVDIAGTEIEITIKDNNTGFFGRTFDIYAWETEFPNEKKYYEVSEIREYEIEQEKIKIGKLNYTEICDLLKEIVQIGNAIARAKYKEL